MVDTLKPYSNIGSGLDNKGISLGKGPVLNTAKGDVWICDDITVRGCFSMGGGNSFNCALDLAS
jgi:hypothetical protein